MKKISIITPCFNEEKNVPLIVEEIRKVMNTLPYIYEHILIDNCSTDLTWEEIKKASAEDDKIKGIRNARNFGPLRSVAHAMFNGDGDCIIALACDLQEPPSLIPEFIQKWEEGYKVVFGQKTESDESKIMYSIRGLYYDIIARFSEIPQFKQTTGFGLYDKEVVKMIESLHEPEPSLRHIIAELGYKVAFIDYCQPKRIYGKSKFSLFFYFDYAFNTLINTSQLPLKMAVSWGFFTSFVSFAIGLVYLIWKCIDWMHFDMGLAPVLIGLFFIGGVLLMFIGIIGEYIGEILRRTKIRPLVIESERINFDK